ncbi:telomerase-binding protein EST1A protein [Colletotrichum tofieldiae]|nr:telomerase-binding protein EST1A protein [Colletotrichum tofieldiae]
MTSKPHGVALDLTNLITGYRRANDTEQRTCPAPNAVMFSAQTQRKKTSQATSKSSAMVGLTPQETI